MQTNIAPNKVTVIFAGMLALILCIVAAIYLTKPGEAVRAGSNDNVYGWAWSSNIGWISMNSLNCDADNNGQSDGSPTGCPSAGTNIPSYGVRIDSSTGEFSGYAWSENIGWINFNPDTSSVPENPSQGVQLSGSDVIGWARALAGESGDAGEWDGWIKVSGLTTGGSFYGVSLSGGPVYDFDGYAWGGDVIGWIDFSGVTYGGVSYAPAPSGSILVNGSQSGLEVSSTTDIALDWSGTNADSCEVRKDTTVLGTGLEDGSDPPGVVIGTGEGLGYIGLTRFDLLCSNSPYHTVTVVDTAEITISTAGNPSLVIDRKLVQVEETVTLTYDTNGNVPEQCAITGPGNEFPFQPPPGSETGDHSFTVQGAATYILTCSIGDPAEVKVNIVPDLWES